MTLDDIIDFIDWQTDVGGRTKEEKEALIAASNLIYDFLHKDDPEIHYGN